MSKYVAILTGGVVKVHLPHTNGNYATLCGMDGDDPDPVVDQETVSVPKDAKVDCDDCIAIWSVCRQFTARDFA